MTTPASPDHAEPWYLLGAGNMGLLAAHYLQRAGFTVIALRRDDAPTLERTLILPNGDPVPLQLRCQRPPASETEPLVGAGPAREREQSSRQDPRDLSTTPLTTSLESCRVANATLSRARPARTISWTPVRLFFAFAEDEAFRRQGGDQRLVRRRRAPAEPVGEQVGAQRRASDAAAAVGDVQV